MQVISNITDAPKQVIPVPIPDGTTLTLSLEYRPQQQGWFYDWSWDGQTPPYQNQGNRLVTSPNILRRQRNFIPFGITITTTDGQDPTGQEDFASAYATAILLDASEVIGIEITYFPGK